MLMCNVVMLYRQQSNVTVEDYYYCTRTIYEVLYYIYWNGQHRDIVNCGQCIRDSKGIINSFTLFYYTLYLYTLQIVSQQTIQRVQYRQYEYRETYRLYPYLPSTSLSEDGEPEPPTCIYSTQTHTTTWCCLEGSIIKSRIWTRLHWTQQSILIFLCRIRSGCVLGTITVKIK